jgi:hypothetical protein
MGTWGPGLFSDDIASDVREQYRDLVGDGFEGSAATDELIRSWKAELSDPDVAPVFWLALADTQWKAGRLENRVKVAAMRVLDDGSDLLRWHDDPRLRVKRASVLKKLRLQLAARQPPPKRISKRFRSTCDWVVGEVIAYRLRSGRVVLLRVLEHHVDRGGVSPICEVLDYLGRDVPVRKVIMAARPKTFLKMTDGNGTMLMCATSAREFPRDRIVRTGVVNAPKRSKRRSFGTAVVLWRQMDESLREFFGLK